MTAVEWQRCNDPGQLLTWLAGRASDRKLRLFACACCRRIWHLLDHEPSRRAVETAEQFADGLLPAEQLARARADARQVTWEAIQRVRSEWSMSRINERARGAWVAVWAACAAEETAEARIWSESQPRTGQLNSSSCLPLRTAQVVSWARTVAVEYGLDRNKTTGDQEEAYQCALLRDLFEGQLQPIPIESKWLEYGSGLVVRLARVLHEEGRLDELPVLADALEDASCDNDRLLDHLRSPGPHARGCWVLDALMQKN